MKTKLGITQGGTEEGQGSVHDKGHILYGDGMKKDDGLVRGGDGVGGSGHHHHGDDTGGSGLEQT